MPNTEAVRKEARMDAREYEAPRIELVISEQGMQNETETPPPESSRPDLRAVKAKRR